MPERSRAVWGVYDTSDYYVAVLVDNKLYASREQAEAVRDALIKRPGYDLFEVEEHELVEASA